MIIESRGGEMIPKFRVWFSEASQMITDDLESINLFAETVTITSGYYDNFTDVYAFGSIEVDIGNAILMQSTGLKDLNGVEIYDGDIVRVTDDDGRTDFSDGGIGTVCGLKELGMWYIGGQVQNGLFDINHCYYIEVIGNIYENPELLEVAE